VQDEEEAQQAKRRADAKLEAGLRRRGVLAPDDDLVDAICAPRAVLISYPGDSVSERTASALEKGCCCAFSSRRLYLPHARMVIGLERVWRVECWGTNLAVVFSAEQVSAIGLVTDGLATAAQAAHFAGRLQAQRDQRVAELPDEPRTRVGAWVRALLLRDPELMAKHRRGTEWSAEETTVLQAAFVLQARRFFGDRRDDGAISEFMASFGALVKEKGQQLDLTRTESMVRWALGGSAQDVDGRFSGQELQLAGVVAGFVAHELQMTPHAIWLLVIRSEQMAFDQGWNPPPES
jgi:hypothetical protein